MNHESDGRPRVRPLGTTVNAFENLRARAFEGWRMLLAACGVVLAAVALLGWAGEASGATHVYASGTLGNGGAWTDPAPGSFYG